MGNVTIQTYGPIDEGVPITWTGIDLAPAGDKTVTLYWVPHRLATPLLENLIEIAAGLPRYVCDWWPDGPLSLDLWGFPFQPPAWTPDQAAGCAERLIERLGDIPTRWDEMPAPSPDVAPEPPCLPAI